MIDQYEMILRLAAEYHQLVDFHGANKPTGMERTYPNLVGVEGIRGMEKEIEGLRLELDRRLRADLPSTKGLL